jgi:hypothetical protein
MTRGQEEKLIAAVENPFFKGLARVLIYVSAGLLSLIIWNGNRALDTLDKTQARLEARMDRLELTTANDRKAEADRDVQLNGRIDIVSGRVIDTQHDYARVSDVLVGFTLRDQRIDAIDHRVGALEDRTYSRTIPRDH